MELDFEAIKKRQQQTWAAGDFAMVATTSTIVGELLCEAVDVRPGQKILDVATGSGNTALAAARRWCEVTGIDYVPALLERGRERAAAERMKITFREGDAENIPFPDATFDVILSTFGAIFTPNQERTASELLRVCRPGGKIGMANWTPDGVIGELFRITGRHVPPPPGVKPPALWGTKERLRELFSDGVASIQVSLQHFVFRYHSTRHWLDYFRTYYGPTMKAFEALDSNRQEALARDLLNFWQRVNRSGDETLVAPGEYLEVVAFKK